MELGNNYVIYLPTDGTMFDGNVSGTAYADQKTKGSWLNCKGMIAGALWYKAVSGTPAITLVMVAPDGTVLDNTSYNGNAQNSWQAISFNQTSGPPFPLGDIRIQSSGAGTNLQTYFFGIYGGAPSAPNRS